MLKFIQRSPLGESLPCSSKIVIHDLEYANGNWVDLWRKWSGVVSWLTTRLHKKGLATTFAALVYGWEGAVVQGTPHLG